MFTRQLLRALMYTGLLLPASARFVSAALVAETGKVPYYTTFAEAKAEATKRHLPVAVDFITDWCVWCKVMDTTLYTDKAGVDFYTKEAVLAKLDAEKADSLLARSYGVVAYPTVVYMKPDGTEYDRMVGYAPTTEYLAGARDYLAGKGTLATLLADEKKSPSRDNEMKIAGKYEYRNKKEESRMWLTKVIGDGSKNDSLAGEAHSALFDMLRNEKKYDEALTKLAMMEKAFAGTSFAEFAVRKTGGTYLRMGDTAKAVTAFERYLSLYPSADAVPDIKELLAKIKTPNN